MKDIMWVLCIMSFRIGLRAQLLRKVIAILVSMLIQIVCNVIEKTKKYIMLQLIGHACSVYDIYFLNSNLTVTPLTMISTNTLES